MRWTQPAANTCYHRSRYGRLQMTLPVPATRGKHGCQWEGDLGAYLVKAIKEGAPYVSTDFPYTPSSSASFWSLTGWS